MIKVTEDRPVWLEINKKENTVERILIEKLEDNQLIKNTLKILNKEFYLHNKMCKLDKKLESVLKVQKELINELNKRELSISIDNKSSSFINYFKKKFKNYEKI